MTTVRLLKNGIEAFPAMLDAISLASSSIALEMYIFADDATGREFRSTLIAAARRGVDTEVLIDAVGSWQLPDAFWDELRGAGGRVRWFRPITRGMFFFRNHRKLLLIDNQVAFIGGINIADEYYQGRGGRPPWRDNVLEITGSQTTRLRRSFTRMWSAAESPWSGIFGRFRHDRRITEGRGALVRFIESGPENPLHPVRRYYRRLIREAHQSIDLAMGYFFPHGRLLRELKRAVQRGVRVRLLVSRQSDVPVALWAARGLYGRLLRAGAEVWEYRPTMLHAKIAIVDQSVIAGSANLDIRSGRINYELVALVRDPELAAQARKNFEEDLTQAERISLEAWRKRPLIRRLKERLSFFILARLDIFIARAEMARSMR